MKIAILQMTSVLEPEVNLATIDRYAKEAAASGAKALFLPETFYSFAHKTPHLVKEGDKSYEAIRAIAKNNQIYLIGGSASTLVAGKVVNRAFNFSSSGEDLGHYDKINLFSCEIIRDGKTIKKVDEGEAFVAGNKRHTVTVGNWKIGETICFDLRFSELYKEYRELGCHLMTIASAFTVPTGRAHWHTLVRARAIESQCYVVAVGQYGKHNETTETFGHSLVVDPWGEIVVDAKETIGLHYADLDLNKITEVRQAVHMRREFSHD